MYKEKRSSQGEFVPIRGLHYHVQRWAGTPGAGSAPPPLVLLHGWMDVAASYQFMVDAFSDAFAQGRTIIAPDWRGFGLTDTPGADHYWFGDYLADLDFLLDHYAPDQAVDLVGHSMGGNVAMLYAGVRPERIRRLVNLEGFGMAATTPDEAPSRYAKWMDELKKLHRGELDLKAYEAVSGVARRLMKTNPRLGQDKANWLAQHWAHENAQGKWSILGNPSHKISNAQLYRVDELLEIYQRISMPVLSVEASDNSLELWWKGKFTLAEFHERLKSVPQVEIARIEDAGHMMHHDQPEILAALIERFLAPD
jgi:pimeloyl-ACP methyl ester carboxylesterase